MSHDDVDDRSAWRSQWRLLKDKLDQPIPSQEDLLDILLAPLVLVGLEQTNDIDAELVEVHGKWEKLKIGSPLPEEALRNFHWIGEFQMKLLQVIIPDWLEVLKRHDLLSFILHAWFAPQKHGAVTICTLATLNSILSDSQTKQRPETWEIIQLILPSFIKNISLSSIIKCCLSINNSSQRELQWTNTIRHMLSLPDRIANAYQGQFPSSLSPQTIRAKVGSEVEQSVFDESDAHFVAILLNKMLRAGWFHDTQNWNTDSLSVWPSILRGIAKRVDDEQIYKVKWDTALSRMEGVDQNALMTSLVEAIDVILKKSGKAQLMNEKEMFRPGAEGMEFLSTSTWQNALQIGSFLELFLVQTEDNSTLSHLFQKTWAPLTTRILVHIVDKRDKDFVYRNTLLHQSIKVWSQQTKFATWNEEEYWITVLALLISTAPSTSHTVQSLSTMPDFIQGVSQHLSHLSPTRRRMGMLLAEMVSERSGKALKFGKSAWDGKGEGREEARVLRTLALGFQAREIEVKLSQSSLLAALQLDEVTVKPVDDLVIKPKKVKSGGLTTKVLPIRKPAPARTPMISMIGSDEEVGNDSKKLISSLSDEEEVSSSSESESSSDDEEEVTAPSGQQEEGKAFGMGTPNNKKKVHVPIYIGQLAPLLRSNERDGVRMGVKYAEDLIRRKTGYGGEVHENAIDLCLAVLAVQNNFKIAQFDQRRVGALTALVLASPTLVAPCLVEQYFDHQYSMIQRIAMLNALAFGATELATRETNSTKTLSVNRLAEQFSQLAMQRPREEGKERIPEIRNEEALMIRQKSIQSSALSKSSGDYLSFASNCFIFPMVNRLWNHIQSAGMHANRTPSNYMGAGKSIIDMPFLMGALLDTLAVLCHHAKNETKFRQDVLPEICQMILALTRTQLSQLSSSLQPQQHDEDEDGGSQSTILGASASLILTLLDSAWQLDFGKSVARQNVNLLNEVQVWANAVFEAAENGFGNRSGRASAAILLRINEIFEHQRKDVEIKMYNK